MTTYTRSLDAGLLEAVLNALDLPLDNQEWALALDTVRALAASWDEAPPDLAAQIVGEVEKVVGLGLEEGPFVAAVAAVRRVLAQDRSPDWPVPAPDAFLEAAYEDRLIETD
jgi:hypothetical protein